MKNALTTIGQLQNSIQEQSVTEKPPVARPVTIPPITIINAELTNNTNNTMRSENINDKKDKNDEVIILSSKTPEHAVPSYNNANNKSMKKQKNMSFYDLSPTLQNNIAKFISTKENKDYILQMLAANDCACGVYLCIKEGCPCQNHVGFAGATHNGKCKLSEDSNIKFLTLINLNLLFYSSKSRFLTTQKNKKPVESIIADIKSNLAILEKLSKEVTEGTNENPSKKQKINPTDDIQNTITPTTSTTTSNVNWSNLFPIQSPTQSMTLAVQEKPAEKENVVLITKETEAENQDTDLVNLLYNLGGTKRPFNST